VNPDESLIEKSINLWAELLPILRPMQIICSGKVAGQVLKLAKERAVIQVDLVNLRLPSPISLSRVSGMFTKKDLLQRYPEVLAVVNAHQDWVGNTHCLNKIFFACHAVSIVGNSRSD
jgi:hypothetical protein